MIGQAHLGYISDWLDSRNSVPGMGTGAASIFLPPALHQLFIDWDNNLLLPRHRIFLVSSHIPHSYCSEFPIPHSYPTFAFLFRLSPQHIRNIRYSSERLKILHM